MDRSRRGIIGRAKQSARSIDEQYPGVWYLFLIHLLTMAAYSLVASELLRVPVYYATGLTLNVLILMAIWWYLQRIEVPPHRQGDLSE